MQCKSMLVVRSNTQPMKPNFLTPNVMPIPKVSKAIPVVTENDPVGAPAQGNMPSKFITRMK